MTFHEYLAKARQDDAQRADERDRPLLTAAGPHAAASPHRCYRPGMAAGTADVPPGSHIELVIQASNQLAIRPNGS
jgi:hypothetical protein